MPPEMTDASLRRIISRGQVNNRRNDITGVLAVGPGLFAQILEGAPEAVDATLARIRRDSRHGELLVAADELVSARSFDRCSMELLGDEHAASLVEEVRRRPEIAGQLVDYLVAQMVTDPPQWRLSLRAWSMALAI